MSIFCAHYLGTKLLLRTWVYSHMAQDISLFSEIWASQVELWGNSSELVTLCSASLLIRVLQSSSNLHCVGKFRDAHWCTHSMLMLPKSHMSVTRCMITMKQNLCSTRNLQMTSENPVVGWALPSVKLPLDLILAAPTLPSPRSITLMGPVSQQGCQLRTYTVMASTGKGFRVVQI